MKVFVSIIAGGALAVSILSGCNSGSSPDYVDSYTVNLTEQQGASYSGDYFPIQAGYQCNYSGSASMRLHMSANVQGFSNMDTTIASPATGYLKILAARPVVLTSGTYSLYPVVDASNMSTGMSSQTTLDTSRFFMKDAQAVYIKALKLSDGSYLEVDNPVYIKSTLIVGDSWLTAPKMDMTKLLASELGSGSESNLTLNAKAMFFVVGHESISLPIGTRSTMRVEQANEITMSGTMMSEGITVSMNLSARLGVVYNLIADTGIVKQNITGPLTLAASAQGQTINITITFNRCDLGLVSVSLNGAGIATKSLPKASITSAEAPAALQTPVGKQLWKVSQAAVAVVEKRFGL
jgi:hypothetical protein